MVRVQQYVLFLAAIHATTHARGLLAVTDTYPVSSPRPLYGFPSSDPPDRRAPKRGPGGAARARPVPVHQALRIQETDGGVRLAGGRPVDADADGVSDVHSTVPPPYAPY